MFEHRGSGCHLSAEEVHQQLASLQLKVSLATVYRTLRLLADMGFPVSYTHLTLPTNKAV